MNKKVSTLLTVGLMLGGSLLSSSAFAHVPEYRTIRTHAGITAVDATINHITADKWYQLRTTMIVDDDPVPALLVQERDQQTGKLYLKAVPENECRGVYLLPSLWRIQYTEKDGVGGGKFAFVNKETNMELAYDHTFSAEYPATEMTKDNGVLEACNTTWEWYNNNYQSLKFAEVEPYAYTDAGNDQVMVMKMDTDGFIYSVVGKSSEMLDNHGVLDAVGAVKIQPVVATAIVLNAQDFNSMIDFNKASMKQNAGFKFYKPNGDLLNEEEMSFVSEGIMGKDMTYHAERDLVELFRIQREAARELSTTDFTTLESKQTALKAAIEKYDAALAKADNARSEYNQAESNKKALELEKAASEKAYNLLYAESETVKEKITFAVNSAETFITAFDSKITLWGLKVVPNADPDAAKKEFEKALASYKVETNEVAKAYKGIEVSVAAVNFYNCYYLLQDSDSSHKDAWSKTQTDATVDLEEYYKVLVRLRAALDKVEEYTRLLTEATKDFNKKKNALVNANAALDTACTNLKAAKNNISSALPRTAYIVNDGYLRWKNVEESIDKDKYLMVDTAFWQTNQVPSKNDLKIVHKTPNPQDDPAISARYFFKTTYYPTQDSLVIEPLNASAISDREYESGTLWKDSYAGQNFVYADDLTADASAASNTVTAQGEGSNLPIVLKLDELENSGLCLTASRANIAAHSFLKTRIAFNNPYDYLKRTTLKEGLYFIKSKKTGKYIVANMSGKLQYDVEEANAQDYNDMPATMFVVEKAGCENGTRVKVHNREYGDYNYLSAFEGQFYIDEDGTYIINKRDYKEYFDKNQELTIEDHFEFIPVTTEEALTSDKHGYKFLDPEILPYTEYALHYNLAANPNLHLNVDADNFVKATEGEKTYYQLETVNPVTGKKTEINKFGYGEGVLDETSSKELKELERQAYVLKVRDANLVDNDTTYVALVKEAGQNEYYKAMGIKDIRAGKGQIAQFYLKADQRNDGTKYYALVDIRHSSYWADELNGVRQAKYTDANANLSHVDLDNEPSERASAFALVTNDRHLYRTMPEGKINLYRVNGGAEQKLFEDRNNQTGASSVVSNFGYLGLLQENMTPKGEGSTSALQVDPIVNQYVRMPQYMLAVAMDTIADGYWCSNNTHGYFASKDEAESKDKNHYVFYNGYTAGRFLVNLADSVTVGSHAYHKPDKFTYNGRAVRLGFVEGVHMNITVDEAGQISEFLNKDIKAGEYFFTLLNGLKLKDLQNKEGYIIPEKLFDEKNTKMNVYEKGKHNDWSFSFRLIDDNQDEFLIESNLDDISEIGSMQGAWIKIINSCPVLNKIDGNHSSVDGYGLFRDNITDGEVFSVKSTDEVATSNEGISTSNVAVVAQDGAIVVKNAAGKNVVVSTILGQVVANEVLTSDNATINVPAGIVVVAVEGESFKVNVK